MNLLIKRNIEAFLNLLGIQFKTIEKQIELNFESFDFFIEVIDGELFFSFSISYDYKRFINAFSSFSPEKTVGVIAHIFVYEDRLCISYMIDSVDVYFMVNVFNNNVKIIEKVVRSKQ
ncbi:TPA: T3SS regulator Mpc [Salmonella enterica]|nr:T3SS regulator Mpc [Salmonella enterica]HAF4702281.1 T3SS regulator Mpc [Salmonella enterica]